MNRKDLLIAFDTETTGLDFKNDRLVEIAGLYFDPATGEIADTLHLYINPGVAVSEESIAVHGLTNEFLADKPTFAEVADQVIEFCTGRGIVIHNARFDTRFMNEAFKRAKMKAKMETIGSAIIDTLAMSRKAVKSKKHTLDTLCDRYGVDRTKRTLHGALVDCELLAAVYAPLSEDYQRILSKLNALLSAPLGAPIPATEEEKVALILELKAVASFLSSEEDRITDALKAQVQGQDTEGDGWRIRFQNARTTNWDKVKKELLAGVTLDSYQTATSKMYVEGLD